MPLDYYTVEKALPEAGKQIAICYSSDKKRAWLELTNFDFLLTKGCSNKIVTFLVGAVPDYPRTSRAFDPDEVEWRLIDKRAADAHRDQRVYIEADLGPSQILDFQDAIIKSWNNYQPSRAADYAKGT